MRGLILCGGQSVRMGFDKSTLKKNGKYLFQQLAEEFLSAGVQPYLSVRSDQTHLLNTPYPYIEDSGDLLGPILGIKMAMESEPESAWLVVACDMPLLDRKVFNYMIAHRNEQKIATVFKFEDQKTGKELILPLPAIYEPSFYPLMTAHLKEGQWSPKKMLESADCEILQCTFPEKMININKPGDFIDLEYNN
nr:molybdenum cofactor guanylyltransferase [Saprospiraceae bacterium]